MCLLTCAVTCKKVNSFKALMIIYHLTSKGESKVTAFFFSILLNGGLDGGATNPVSNLKNGPVACYSR